jgi:hypothetical protein
MRGAGRKPGPEHSYNFVSLSSPKSGKSRGWKLLLQQGVYH